MIRQDRKHLHEIDALRGIAAVLVACVFHLFFLFGDRFTAPMGGLPVMSWLYDHGWTMVDLFFVVSGYIFSHVYLSENALKPDTTIRSFFVARLARLYPLHFLTMILIIPAILLHGGGVSLLEKLDLYHFGLNALMLQGSGLQVGYSFNVVSWSISVEVLCYVLFFMAARLGGRSLAILSVIVIVSGTMLTFTSSSETIWAIGRGLSGFFAGCVAWRLRELRSPSWLLLVCAVLPFALVPAFFNYGNFLGLTAFPAAVLLAQRLPILRARCFRWLGARSYSIYLWHPVVYMSARGFLPGLNDVAKEYPFLVALAAIAIVIFLSDLSYRFFETPMRHVILKKLVKPTAQSQLGASAA